jgi:serine/threonine protein kinase
MVKYLPGSATIKLGDFGNAVSHDRPYRIGGTIAYAAPENVIGLTNRGGRGDVFSAAIVLIEAACRSLLMPTRLPLAYQESSHPTQGLRRKWVHLYHLVLLSSLIEQRPVYAGEVVRQYFGNMAKHRILEVLRTEFSTFDDDLCSITVSIQHSPGYSLKVSSYLQAKIRSIKRNDPGLHRFLRTLLCKQSRRPTARVALEHPWFTSV